MSVVPRHPGEQIADPQVPSGIAETTHRKSDAPSRQLPRTSPAVNHRSHLLKQAEDDPACGLAAVLSFCWKDSPPAAALEVILAITRRRRSI